MSLESENSKTESSKLRWMGLAALISALFLPKLKASTKVQVKAASNAVPRAINQTGRVEKA